MDTNVNHIWWVNTPLHITRKKGNEAMAKQSGIMQIKTKSELSKRVKVIVNVSEQTHKRMLMLNDLIATKIYPKRLNWTTFIELMVWKYQDEFAQDIIKDFDSLEAVEIS